MTSFEHLMGTGINFPCNIHSFPLFVSCYGKRIISAHALECKNRELILGTEGQLGVCSCMRNREIKEKKGGGEDLKK